MGEGSVGKILIGLALFASSGTAFAQGYVIQRPGQMPTFVNPSGNGGYVVQNPGQMPTFVNPTGNGGYVAQSPGQMPTFINPTGPTPQPLHQPACPFGRC